MLKVKLELNSKPKWELYIIWNKIIMTSPFRVSFFFWVRLVSLNLWIHMWWYVHNSVIAAMHYWLPCSFEFYQGICLIPSEGSARRRSILTFPWALTPLFSPVKCPIKLSIKDEIKCRLLEFRIHTDDMRLSLSVPLWICRNYIYYIKYLLFFRLQSCSESILQLHLVLI